MSNWVTLLNEYSSKDLEQRKIWYSPVVEAYDRARPHYPQQLIERSTEVAKLAPDSKILEVGCGSAIAPKYEGRETQAEILDNLGKLVGDSGLFEPPVAETMPCERTYDVERYLGF